MPLQSLDPLTYQNFQNDTGAVINCIVELIPQLRTCRWLDLLNSYEYREQNTDDGINVRLQFNARMTQANTPEQKFIVANEILRWGGMNGLDDNMRTNLLDSFGLLQQLAAGNRVHIHDLYVNRIASVSKLYEMYDLDNWIIYDSYSVRGLQWMVQQVRVAHQLHNENRLRFPWPLGRAGGPIAGFPRGSTLRQMRLGFIYGSWLCKSIAATLNQRNDLGGDFHWRTFHIEMAAFQLGHEVQ